MFRIFSIIAFLITLAAIAIHCVSTSRKRQGTPRDIAKGPVHLLTILFFEQKLNLIGILRKLLYLVALLCFMVLLITSFYPVIFQGAEIHGYWLMLHATFAPVFAVCLAVLAVMWAHNSRFDKNYCPWLQRIIQRQPKNPEIGKKYECTIKICFWLIVILALPLMLSILLSMFPLFGTKIQKLLLNIHRCTALVLAMIVIIHTYLTIRTKMKG